MGKTADLTVVQKTTIDILHKEGKTQKVIAKEAGCSQSSVSKHINREAKGRKRCGRKKCTSNRDNRTLERIVKQNPFKNVGQIHKEWTAAGVSASRTTTHRRMQDMGFSCRIPCVKPLLNNRQRQKRLAWAKDKKDWTAALFWLSMEAVAFSPRPHPYLPCFAPLSRERLSLHCSPN